MQDSIALTIIMPTFNKKDYIAQALDSIFMQKTTYRYQIIVADDASSDGTLDIVRQYSLKYPDTIKILESSQNQKLFKNVLRAYKITKTQYFCVLDPDDYWIDDQKIQKALDFLEENKDFTIYSQNTQMLDESGGMEYFIHCKEENTSDFNDYLNDRAMFGHTSSCVFRNVIFKDGLPHQLITPQCASEEFSYRGDSYRNLVHIHEGKAKFIPEVDSVYRITKEGVWQSLDDCTQMIGNCIFYKDMWLYFDKRYIELLYFSYRLSQRLLRPSSMETICRLNHDKFIELMDSLYELHGIYEPFITQLKEGRKPKGLKYKLFLSCYKFLHKKLTKKGFL